MNPEKTKIASSENLTRRQKLLRRAVPIAFLAAGTAGAVGYELSQDNDIQPETSSAEVTTTVSVSTELGGAESDWGHGAATSLIEEAVAEGVDNAVFDLDHDGKSDISEKETEEMLGQVPTYDQANQLLNEAGYNKALPDEGDILQATIAVTTDTDKNVSYKIIDAEIKDIPNNQNKEQ